MQYKIARMIVLEAGIIGSERARGSFIGQNGKKENQQSLKIFDFGVFKNFGISRLSPSFLPHKPNAQQPTVMFSTACRPWVHEYNCLPIFVAALVAELVTAVGVGAGAGAVVG